MSGKRDARLRRPDKLRGRRPRWFVRTTDSGHAEPVAPNTPAPVFARAAMGGPDRVWASEITSLRTPRGWRYLAIVLDLAARQVVGGHARTTLGEDLPLALRPALVRAHEGSVSMSRRGNCYDNAVVESFFATLKIEWGATFDWDDEVATRRDLIDFIEVWYNRQLRHSTLGYLSPVAYENPSLGRHVRLDQVSAESGQVHSADVALLYGNVLCFAGQIDAGLAQLDRAFELDRLNPFGSYCREWCLYLARRYDAVMAQHARTAALSPTFIYIDTFLGAAYWEQGRYQEALAAYARAKV